MIKVFIDGKEGTTGLRIFDRLSERDDLTLITLPEKRRKDPALRKEALNESDVSILCLPDAAAIEAVGMVENPNTRIIDPSTAHRIADGWVYGLPEPFDGGHEAVLASKRVAVPGCHASGFITLIAPLVREGILKKDALLTCTSLTGYSGGGHKMIAQYESDYRDVTLKSPRLYALNQKHKHLPEMRHYTGLNEEPAFFPVVADYFSGMLTVISVFPRQLAPGMGAEDIRGIYRERYTGPLVRYREKMDENGYLSSGKLSSRDGMDLSVAGSEEHITLLARFDNLGKGASGAAIQCMNIMMGADQYAGLILGED
ncbi:MAG TPA: N-acetyl-gamma-glutamyl-phosphate reductase [Eubacteriales bacterium]|mgnify:CR=1 FL=1|nr:N-acetyl-gamma-glutamyl-phosphate reductase [Eubacteriales bacterium]